MSNRWRIDSCASDGACIAVPPSKSVANRALVCASLAEGTSELVNVPLGDDTRRMVDGLRAMGTDIEVMGSLVVVRPNSLTGEVRVDCGLAGTTSRFLTTFALTRESPTVLDGADRLRERPMQHLHSAVRQLGGTVDYLGQDGYLPVRISPSTTYEKNVSVRGDASSQFLSSLMLVGPALGGLEITLEGPLVSRPYIDMTIGVMRRFGADVTVSDGRISVGARPYRACHFDIEPDFSSAAFLVGAAVVGRMQIRIPKLAKAQLQGDSFILEIARRMGARVVVDHDDIVVDSSESGRLTPVEVDLSDSSDLVPIVAVMALFAEGESVLNGVGFIRGKESNRIDDLSSELAKSGAAITTSPDGMTISGSQSLHSADLFVHDDHRLAMAFAVLGIGVAGISIDDSSVVSKSWPTFWTDMSPVLKIVPR